jgi:hypothetical protein
VPISGTLPARSWFDQIHYSTGEDAMPMTHRHRLARIAGPALVLAAAGLLSVPALSPAQAATAPTATQILRSIGQQPHVTVTRVHAEGPAVVVNDGFCTELRSAGCQLAEHTKDASLIRFDTAKNAKAYAGNADDQATAMGRVVVSFGSPARMGSARQKKYEDAVAAFRSSHPARKDALVRMSHYLTFHHLPMRDAFLEQDVDRTGLATTIPGATDMATSHQVDVIVFGSRDAAKAYVAKATKRESDQTFRHGRLVLSFGNPSLVGPTRQAAYADALRAVVG